MPLTTDGVDLVDKHDSGRSLFRLFKEVAHAACADADVHFHKVRSGDGEKLHARFARDRTGKQRLARARRADEQHSLGNACADIRKLLRVLQELYQFLHLFLFFL